MTAPHIVALCLALALVADPAFTQSSRPTPDQKEPDRSSGGGDDDSDRDGAPRAPDAGPSTWSLCNSSTVPVIDAVVAWQDSGRWRSSRWQRVGSGQCLTLRAVPSRYVYFYASSRDRAWAGNHDLCLDLGTGRVRAGDGCPQNMRSVPFRRVVPETRWSRLR